VGSRSCRNRPRHASVIEAFANGVFFGEVPGPAIVLMREEWSLATVQTGLCRSHFFRLAGDGGKHIMLLVGAITPDATVALIERDFRASARWRREKAVEYPSDKRNLEAAVLLDRLADTVKEDRPCTACRLA
jgi:hypothetical protein